MIQYRVWAENRIEMTAKNQKRDVWQTATIYETGKNEYTEKSVFTQEIRDRMFDGQYEFTLLPQHPAYDFVRLGLTTIYIEDNGREVFRGRAVRSKKDRYGRKTVTCENDLKFLIDVPDIFSKPTASGVVYKYGDAVKTEGGDKVDRQEHINLQRKYAGQGVYSSGGASRPDYATITTELFVQLPKRIHFNSHADGDPDRPPYKGHAELFSDRKFTMFELGKVFDVFIGDMFTGITRHYRCQLRHKKIDNNALRKKYPYPSNLYYREDIRDILYLGNLSLYYNDPVFGEIDVGTTPGDADKIVNADESETEITDPLDFCIMHVIGNGRWNQGVGDVGQTILMQSVSSAYTEVINPTGNPKSHGWFERSGTREPYEFNETEDTSVDPTKTYYKYVDGYRLIKYLNIVVKRSDYTSVIDMYERIFCPYTEDESELYGYNLFVPPERRIYAGNVEVIGSLQLTDVGTVYSNLQKWLDVTDGYAKLRKTDGGYYVLDLLAESGVQDDRITLEIGTVTDYSQDHDITSMVTAIYPVGTVAGEYDPVEVLPGENEEDKPKNPVRYKLGGYVSQVGGSISDDELSLTDWDGTTLHPVVPTDAFPMLTDARLNLVYNKKAVQMYGWNVQYKTYTIKTTMHADRLQDLYNQTQYDLASMLTAHHAYTATAVDPRLLGDSTSPVLGNYYLCSLSVFDAQEYMPLTKIVTDMIKPSGSKMTVGDDIHDLSDYVAKKEK